MARGRPGAFGGKTLTSWPLWLALSALFFAGLADLRRPHQPAQPRRARPALVRRPARVLQPWRDLPERRAHGAPARLPPRPLGVHRLPLAAAEDVRAGDPGLAAARGDALRRRASRRPERRDATDGDRCRLRRRHRRAPASSTVRRRTGTCRSRDRCPGCGPADADGRVRNRIQENGRCEASNPHGDTYGPVAYLAYVPAVAVFGWSGKWDDLPAAHAAAILFDLLTLLGLFVLGRRLGGMRLAATLVVRLGRLSVHGLRADGEHERRAHARAPRLGLRLRHVARPPGVRRSRSPAGRSSRRSSSRRSGSRTVARRTASSGAGSRSASSSRASPRSRSCCSSPTSGRGGEDVLAADARVPVRPRLAVLDLGVGAVPRRAGSRILRPDAGSSRRARSRSPGSQPCTRDGAGRSSSRR